MREVVAGVLVCANCFGGDSVAEGLWDVAHGDEGVVYGGDTGNVCWAVTAPWGRCLRW